METFLARQKLHYWFNYHGFCNSDYICFLQCILFKKFKVYDPYSVLGTVIKYSSVLIDFTAERIEQILNSYKIQSYFGRNMPLVVCLYYNFWLITRKDSCRQHYTPLHWSVHGNRFNYKCLYWLHCNMFSYGLDLIINVTIDSINWINVIWILYRYFSPLIFLILFIFITAMYALFIIILLTCYCVTNLKKRMPSKEVACKGEKDFIDHSYMYAFFTGTNLRHTS